MFTAQSVKPFALEPVHSCRDVTSSGSQDSVNVQENYSTDRNRGENPNRLFFFPLHPLQLFFSRGIMFGLLTSLSPQREDVRHGSHLIIRHRQSWRFIWQTSRKSDWKTANWERERSDGFSDIWWHVRASDLFEDVGAHLWRHGGGKEKWEGQTEKRRR